MGRIYKLVTFEGNESKLYEKDLTRIDDTLILSGAIDNYNLLVEKGVSAVVNCRAEQHDDILELTRRGISYYYLPFADATIPRRDQIQTFLEICEREQTVLVHCTLGVGRSAFLVIAYFGYFYDLGLEESIKKLKRDRPIVDFNDVQIKGLEKLFRCGGEI